MGVGGGGVNGDRLMSGKPSAQGNQPNGGLGGPMRVFILRIQGYLEPGVLSIINR